MSQSFKSDRESPPAPHKIVRIMYIMLNQMFTCHHNALSDFASEGCTYPEVWSSDTSIWRALSPTNWVSGFNRPLHSFPERMFFWLKF